MMSWGESPGCCSSSITICSFTAIDDAERREGSRRRALAGLSIRGQRRRLKSSGQFMASSPTSASLGLNSRKKKTGCFSESWDLPAVAIMPVLVQ